MSRHILDTVDLIFAPRRKKQQMNDARPSRVAKTKKVNSPVIGYSRRFQGQWHQPEYDFEQISISRDVDGFIMRSIMKKVNRIICAGWSFVGKDPSAVDYINKRVADMDTKTNRPLDLLIVDTFFELFSNSNVVWAKVRDAEKSIGRERTDIRGLKLDPVAGYFPLALDTLEVKTKRNGDIIKLKQEVDGNKREFSPVDIVHFYFNRKPGFTFGTPEILPALDDIALLRSLEADVEDLIHSNLFPVFHYMVGSDAMPETLSPEGVPETDYVKENVEYMPAGGIYVSDHRHKIEVIGSQGNAMRIDMYLSYFKNRALSSLGTSAIDMGEGATANKSTASTLSKGMLLDVEAMTEVFKRFFDFYVIRELLEEGGYDTTDPQNLVGVKFGVIDKEERRADENQQIQLFHGNVRDINEVRRSLGEPDWEDEQFELTHFSMYEEPAALIKGMGAGSAAGETLAGHTASNVDPSALEKEKKFAEKQAASKTAGQSGAAKSPSSTGAGRQSAAKARPSNQHGTRSGPKTNRDVSVHIDGEDYTFACDYEPTVDKVLLWSNAVRQRYETFKDYGIRPETVASNMLPALAQMHEESNE